MHRVVIFSEKVISNGISIFGGLYGADTTEDILKSACLDYKTLLIREQWEGERGDAFRKREGWTLDYNENGTVSWWRFDETKYTYNLGYIPIPDQFVQLCNRFAQQVAVISGWVPLRFADTDNEDHIVNGTFYYMVANANPNDIQWTDVEEPEADDLPF